MADTFVSTIRNGAIVPMDRRAFTAATREGERVAVTIQRQRSRRSHDHYFAIIAEAWANLPERVVSEPWAASPEHLRKYALIRAGYADVQTFLTADASEGKRLAGVLRTGLRDRYSLVVVADEAVSIFTAQSQSRAAMGAEKFQASKDAVFAFLSELIGADVTQFTETA